MHFKDDFLFGPHYSWTFFLRISTFSNWQKWSKMTIFQSKNGLFINELHSPGSQ
jgi:hypothetical protein